ncbi:response regulator transcription factor [Saccharothrix sp. AJ9571]|nr:response regulator transcription factor [Saccharothrix sp. AJ9571]
MRVFLIDRQGMLAEALAARLAAARPLALVGCAPPTAPELFATVDAARPEVIVVDLVPVASTTPAFLTRLAAAAPDARVVVLTDDQDPARIAVAARWGVAAWVAKQDCSADHLITVVCGVRDGMAYFRPEQIGFVLEALRTEIDRAGVTSTPLDVLSEREHDVLRGIVDGKPAGQIADELFLSVNTVRTHTHNLFGKLKVHSRIEAAAVARAAGMAPRVAPAERALAKRLRHAKPWRNGSGEHTALNDSTPYR